MSIKPENTTKSKVVLKLLLLGDVSVGKSSLLVRYADQKFDNSRVTTIGVENRNVDIKIDGKNISLQSTFYNMKFGIQLDRKNGDKFPLVTTEECRG